ncbi:MAG: hypothetical protein HOP15_02740 [Planctomycetes bacterium]|nr:hypothetical protein [Planctomycetota bacterium]
MATQYGDLAGATLKLGDDNFVQIESIVLGVDTEFDFFYPYVKGTLADGTSLVIDERDSAIALFDKPTGIGGFYLMTPRGSREWIESLQLGVDLHGRMAVLGKRGIGADGQAFDSTLGLGALGGVPCIRVASWGCAPVGCPNGTCSNPPACPCSSGGTTKCKKIGQWSCPDEADCPASTTCDLIIVVGEYQCTCK